MHGIHTVAQMRAVLGDVETVYVQESHTKGFPTPEVEGTMTALLGMASGISVTLVQSCETKFERDQRGYTLYGEWGTIRASKSGAVAYSADAEAPKRIEYPEQPLSEYALEFQAFADYVFGGKEGATSGHSEIKSLAIIQAGYESARTGEPVNLLDRFGQ